jgi:hypothetical protein
MSTSPSWFDQDKFSRLVKKVGPKNASVAGAPAPPAKTAPDASAKEAAPSPASAARSTSPGPVSAEASQPNAPTKSPAPFLFPAESESESSTENPAPESVSQPTETPARGPASPPAFAFDTSPPAQPIRRTTPLPNLKPIFEYDKPLNLGPSHSQPLPGRPHLTPPVAPSPGPTTSTTEIESFGLRDLPSGFRAPEEEEEDASAEPETKQEPPAGESAPAGSSEPLATVASLKQDVSRVTGERDRALGDKEILRSQMLEFDDVVKERDELAARVKELSRAAEERDDARNEANFLRVQLAQQEDAGSTATSPSDELSRAIEERDSSRRDYAGLREQFETLKMEQVRMRNEPAKKDVGLQQETDAVRAQLAERDEQIKTLKADLDAASKESPDASKLDVNAVAQAREEASIAQRGLALSQKALQETRDALREASEGSSLSRTSLENLKNECATLVQQNMLLQAQHDQVSRELNALKAKAPGRL